MLVNTNIEKKEKAARPAKENFSRVKTLFFHQTYNPKQTVPKKSNRKTIRIMAIRFISSGC
jgi:hypothetical protein